MDLMFGFTGYLLTSPQEGGGAMPFPDVEWLRCWGTVIIQLDKLRCSAHVNADTSGFVGCPPALRRRLHPPPACQQTPGALYSGASPPPPRPPFSSGVGGWMSGWPDPHWGGGKKICVGGGGGRLSPQKEGGGGVGKGAETSEPLCEESPLTRKLGRQAAQTENVRKILFPPRHTSNCTARRGDRFEVMYVGVPPDPRSEPLPDPF